MVDPEVSHCYIFPKAIDSCIKSKTFCCSSRGLLELDKFLFFRANGCDWQAVCANGKKDDERTKNTTQLLTGVSHIFMKTVSTDDTV